MVWNPLFESQLVPSPPRLQIEMLFSVPGALSVSLLCFALMVAVLSVVTTFLVIHVEEDLLHSMV